MTDHPLELALDAAPVLVDPIFLDEALTNIIENAIKYTAAGAALRITALGAVGRARSSD